MAVNKKTLRLQRELRKLVGDAADKTVNDLIKAWKKAWAELNTQYAVALTDAAFFAAQQGRWPDTWQLSRLLELDKALKATRETLEQLTSIANIEIADAAFRSVQGTASKEPGIVASQLPPAEFAAQTARLSALIRPQALDLIVARTATRVASETRPLTARAIDAIHRELIAGIAVGDSPRKMAAQMVKRVEGQFNGGLSRALNIARTETLDAYRAASAYAHNTWPDVVDGWVWLATLDARTCVSCLAQNGSVHPIDQPGPLDHQQGRCARMPKTKSWAELGFDGIDEPADDVPDARGWFAVQPRATQLQIMGPGRLDAFDRGQIGWDDMSLRRDSPDWRPSYTVRPLQDLLPATS